MFCPVPPRFTTVPRDTRVPAGSSPQIRCAAFGDPLPTFLWTKRIPFSSLPKHFKIYPSGDLSIKEVKKSDEGPYVCMASNVIGSVSHEITLSVYGTSSAVPKLASEFCGGSKGRGGEGRGGKSYVHDITAWWTPYSMFFYLSFQAKTKYI